MYRGYIHRGVNAIVKPWYYNPNQRIYTTSASVLKIGGQMKEHIPIIYRIATSNWRAGSFIVYIP